MKRAWIMVMCVTVLGAVVSSLARAQDDGPPYWVNKHSIVLSVPDQSQQQINAAPTQTNGKSDKVHELSQRLMKIVELWGDDYINSWQRLFHSDRASSYRYGLSPGKDDATFVVKSCYPTSTGYGAQCDGVGLVGFSQEALGKACFGVVLRPTILAPVSSHPSDSTSAERFSV